MMEVVDNENLMRIMAEILECLFESTLGMKKKSRIGNLIFRQMRKTNGPTNQDLIRCSTQHIYATVISDTPA